ncbi:MAG: Nif3-like dinuclear metal center hexameric protein [Flavobacteriales bacterium]|nr:Nif3-like dinuclear metal center hexameric protein [Flavobacteriales bacterium]|tara:strand:- start:15240 stop:16337 length:1098 start_codon:yes stop_codon:yes gene_type:complete
MKLFEISNYLDTRVPLAYQEEYDNSGLLIGDKESIVKSVLVCLDCTEEVLDEAIRNKHNLIISHHPIIFSGVKKITNSNYTEKIIRKAIKNDISIYCMHTNLDNIYNGVSFKIAEKIHLEDTKILKNKTSILSKLVTYCPSSHLDVVKEALYSNGAGKVSHLYDRCSYVTTGLGSFRSLDGSQPFIGKVGQDELCEENKIEVVFPSYLKSEILRSLKDSHPYQEVAYMVSSLANDSQVGSGTIGSLQNQMTLNQFLKHVKKNMHTNIIRYSKSDKNIKIKKVAVCGGSGRFLLEDAIRQSADVFITSDFKYHDFFETSGKIIVLDIGHYESEYFTQELIISILKENFSKLAVHLTSKCTNPILYY